MEFIDRCAVAFELLRAIGFAEDGRSPVQGLGMVLQVGLHEFAAFLELLVERVGHAEPVGAAVGEAVFRISRQEVLECLCGVGVFFGLKKREGFQERCSRCGFRVWKTLGDLLEGGCGFVVAEAGLQGLGLHEIDLRQER